jgi:hypothetical protein
VPFPNRASQFGSPERGAPGRPPGILLGKKRRKQLQKARAVQVALIGEVVEKISVSPRVFFQHVLDDESNPLEVRMAAARVLLQFEPADTGKAMSLEQLVELAIHPVARMDIEPPEPPRLLRDPE